MKQLFIKACLVNDPNILHSTLSNQQSKDKYIIKDECRFCKGDKIDDVHITYWSSCWSPCHASCKKQGSKEEAYECQLIDADCNDCKHFLRKGKAQQTGVSHGLCDKLKKQVTAYSNYASGHECFEHRRSL